MTSITWHPKHTRADPAIARRLAMEAPRRPAPRHMAASHAGRRLDDRGAGAGSSLTAGFLVAGSIIIALLALWP